jgi:chromosomal replication initiation ATPase DnaA
MPRKARICAPGALHHIMAGQGVDFDALLRRVARQASFSTEAILSPSKARPRVRARSLLCYLAARCLGMTMTELPRRLSVTVAAVSIAVGRAEPSVNAGEIDLEKILKLNI